MNKEKQLNKELISEAASAFGRAGGLATLKRHGKAHMRRASRLAVQARKSRKKNKDNE